jgi:hypothetical protein
MTNIANSTSKFRYVGRHQAGATRVRPLFLNANIKFGPPVWRCHQDIITSSTWPHRQGKSILWVFATICDSQCAISNYYIQNHPVLGIPKKNKIGGRKFILNVSPSQGIKHRPNMMDWGKCMKPRSSQPLLTDPVMRNNWN